MTGNRISGLKSRDKLLAKDPDHYKKLGKKGGGTPTKKLKGFAARPDLARTLGSKGGYKKATNLKEKRNGN
jgi:uncharacterized protein